MDFDIGNLFYFIVLIIAAISGLFGKKKKQTPGGKAKPEGIFQKLEKQLGSLVDEAKTSVDNVQEEFAPSKQSIAEEEQTVFEAVQEEPEEVYSEPMESYQSPYMQYEGIMGQDSKDMNLVQNEAVKTTDVDEVIEVLELEEEENPDYFEIVKDFDLGTAVIYSAIINRLDY